MKSSFLTLSVIVVFLLSGTPSAWSQEAEAALASIDYEFVHVNDTNNREKTRKVNMRVYLGRESSHYVNQSHAEGREKMMQILKDQGISIAGGITSSVSVSRSRVHSGTEEFYLFPKQQKIWIADGIGTTNYILEGDFPDISWEIGEETKEIGGFYVQQAYATFGGREYTAWFAPELPFQYGPWKLHGLPGLILEASDASGEVQFLFQDFGMLEEGQQSIAMPENAVKATPRQFSRAKEAYDKNPAAARQGGDGGGVQVAETIVVRLDENGNRQMMLSGDAAQAEMERRRLLEETSNNNPLEKK